ATFALSPISLVAGADVRDIRATDSETPIASNRPNGLADTSSRQRFVGGFAEALASHRQWSGALSLRLDSVGNLDTRSLAAASANTLAASATYFWTQINRPVSAVLISTTPTTILEKRQNLGRIVSQGLELHLDIRPTHPISAALEYQYAHALVAQFSAQPSLV